MSFITPDIDGFLEADRELRRQFGNATEFRIPQDPQWPTGTQINPDTGRPYNAMVKPINEPYTSVTVTALTILKEASPLRPQADTDTTPAGRLSGMDVILDVGAADYDTVKGATEFTYATRNYRVTEFKPFAFAGITYRWLVYGQER